MDRAYAPCWPKKFSMPHVHLYFNVKILNRIIKSLRFKQIKVLRTMIILRVCTHQISAVIFLNGTKGYFWVEVLVLMVYPMLAHIHWAHHGYHVPGDHLWTSLQ